MNVNVRGIFVVLPISCIWGHVLLLTIMHPLSVLLLSMYRLSQVYFLSFTVIERASVVNLEEAQ